MLWYLKVPAWLASAHSHLDLFQISTWRKNLHKKYTFVPRLLKWAANASPAVVPPLQTKYGLRELWDEFHHVHYNKRWKKLSTVKFSAPCVICGSSNTHLPHAITMSSKCLMPETLPPPSWLWSSLTNSTYPLPTTKNYIDLGVNDLIVPVNITQDALDDTPIWWW